MVEESKGSEHNGVSCLYGNSFELDELYLRQDGVDAAKVAKVRALCDKFSVLPVEVKKAYVAELERRYREGTKWQG
jgi:hypothetical protein